MPPQQKICKKDRKDCMSPFGSRKVIPLVILGLSVPTLAFLLPSAQRIHSERTRKLTSVGASNLFSDMLSGFKKGPPPPSAFEDTALPWSQLGKLLHDQQTEEERTIPKIREQGRGPTSSKALLRLFDAPDGFEPTITLYRDSAAWCPYCEKVWLQLEEKRIPYKIEKINMRCYGSKPMSFMAMVPSGLLPVANIGGQVITESNDIMFTLEDMFPENNPLVPSAPADEVNALLRLERQLFGAWLRWLTSMGMNQPLRASFESVLKRVEAAFESSGGPYFFGSEFSIVDIQFAPFLERMAASLLYYKAFNMRNNPSFPRLEQWFKAMEQRESFRNIKSDYYTHVHDLPPQIGNCYSDPEAAPFAAEIDGTSGSWELEALASPGIEPIVSNDQQRSKREAAAQLFSNHEAVTRFSLRALGKKGFPPVAAEYADPNATPNEDYFPQLDSALRCLMHSLLVDDVTTVTIPTGLPASEIELAINYLRDRVGVPRDMSFEAARQFRGHMNWLIKAIRSKQH